MLLQAEAVEQRLLRYRPLAHHRPISAHLTKIESDQQHYCKTDFFNKIAYQRTFPYARYEAKITDFVAHYSGWRIALLLLIAVTFVTLGLWMGGAFSIPPASRRYPQAFFTMIGWLSVILFSIFGFIATRMLLQSGEQLRVGPSGIYWKPWSDQTIPWHEVADVTILSSKPQKTIIIHLRDRTPFPGKGLLAATAVADRLLIGGDIWILMGATDRSFVEALAAIERFRIYDS